MSAPQALIEFFRQEAAEYLDRLDQLLIASEHACPDASAFLTHARALRGSATMTRLEGLPDLAATVERIATGLRDGELRWDQRLHFAVRGALVELRALVAQAHQWSEAEQRRSRTQSVALAAVAAGYLAATGSTASPASPVVPISRFFPDDGAPAIVERNPQPPITLAMRFRSDMAAAGDGVARESRLLVDSVNGPGQLALTDGVRRALLGLSDVAESYGAASIAALAVAMARAPLEHASERMAVQSFAHLLMDRERSDQELAAKVKEATLSWPGRRTPARNTPLRSQTPIASATPIRSPIVRDATPPARPATPVRPYDSMRPAAPPPPQLVTRDIPPRTARPTPTSVPFSSDNAHSTNGTPITSPASAAPAAPAHSGAGDANAVVPIQSLLYTGPRAIERARVVRDALRDSLRAAWMEKGGLAADPATASLLDELSDLLDLASVS